MDGWQQSLQLQLIGSYFLISSLRFLIVFYFQRKHFLEFQRKAFQRIQTVLASAGTIFKDISLRS